MTIGIVLLVVWLAHVVALIMGLIEIYIASPKDTFGLGFIYIKGDVCFMQVLFITILYYSNEEILEEREEEDSKN